MKITTIDNMHGESGMDLLIGQLAIYNEAQGSDRVVIQAILPEYVSYDGGPQQLSKVHIIALEEEKPDAVGDPYLALFIAAAAVLKDIDAGRLAQHNAIVLPVPTPDPAPDPPPPTTS